MTQPGAEGDSPETVTDAAPDADTQLAPSSQPSQAWALDDGDDWEPSRFSPGRITAIAVAVSGVLVVGVAAMAGYSLASRADRPSDSASAPPPVAGTDTDRSVQSLTGVYRFDYNPAEQTRSGTAFPRELEDADESYWAFRSSCDGEDCVATGLAVERDNHEKPRTPPLSAVLRFTDDQWKQDPPFIDQIGQPTCIRPDGSIGPGEDTEQAGWTLKPQPGGTFRGDQLITVLTDECGLAASTINLPFTATRISYASSRLQIPDPAGIPAAEPPSLKSGAALDGLYKFTVNNAGQTVNGRPVTGALPDRTEVWAFRSACTNEGCSAVAAQVFEENPQQNTGIMLVLRATEGRWVNEGSVQPAAQCRSGPDSEIFKIGWSIIQQPEGTLRGVITGETLTNGCGHLGYVYKTPVTATPLGDVPQSVAFADPLLFIPATKG